jgi:hypothetical protein
MNPPAVKSARFASNAPHSWELMEWEIHAPDVWPHSTARAQWIARAYRKELIAAKAMVRVGKTLVFMGAPYTKWLESRANHVAEFNGNNPAIGRRQAATENTA